VNPGTGAELGSCFLTAGLHPVGTPSVNTKTAWAGSTAFNTLGVGSAGPVYYSYGVTSTGSGTTGVTFSTVAGYAAATAGNGICVDGTEGSTPAASTNYLAAIAVGNLGGGASVYSLFQRVLRYDANSQPSAIGMTADAELE